MTIAIVIAAQGVDDDVKEYVQNTGTKAHFVESLEELAEALATVLAEYVAVRMVRLAMAVGWETACMSSLAASIGVVSTAAGRVPIT